MTLCLECCIMPKRLQHCNDVWSKAFVVKVLEDINQSQTHTQKQIYWKTHQPHHKHTLAAKHWGYTRDTLILLLVWPCLPLPDPPWPGKHNQLTHSTIRGVGAYVKRTIKHASAKSNMSKSCWTQWVIHCQPRQWNLGEHAKCKELELNLLQWIQCMNMVFVTYKTYRTYRHTDSTDRHTYKTYRHTDRTDRHT